LVATYLFGSTARNQADEFSDVDLLIIVRHYDYQIRRELSRLASKYSISHGVCFSPAVKDLATWERNKSHDTLFYREINHDGVRIC